MSVYFQLELTLIWDLQCNHSRIKFMWMLFELFLPKFGSNTIILPFIPLTPCVHNNCGQNIGPLFNNQLKAYWVQRWIPSFTVGNACPCSESATHGYCEEKCTSIYN